MTSAQGPVKATTAATAVTSETKVTTKIMRKTDKKQYSELMKNLKGTKKLWEDPDFPAEFTSVFFSKTSKNYRDLQWKRPGEICKDPQLFVGGANRFDVQQGALGDCWLLAVVASLTLYDPIFKKVVPSDQDFGKKYIGAFRFNFWICGKWQEVIVDDRLPTSNGKLVYMHSTERNEFWSALLEKAYAKISGCYESLSGGSQAEAMEDFTGGLCETMKINPKEDYLCLYNQLKKYAVQSSLMGCAIESTKIEGVLENGLITGHAYSVTGIDEVQTLDGKKVELIRVRNPWGNDKEWKGKWSDNSSEWTTIAKKDKDRLVSSFEKDGEFWMSFQDFAANFTKVEVCHLSSASLNENVGQKVRWEHCIEEGSWTKNVNAGGCRNFLDSFVTNPQIRVEVTDADDSDAENMGQIIVGLMQKDMRKKKRSFYTIGYVIYKLKDPKCGLLDKNFFKFNTSIAKSEFVNTREVCGRHKLVPGHYVIVPSTFNPGEEADYVLRIYSQKPNKTAELDNKNQRTPRNKDKTDSHDLIGGEDEEDSGIKEEVRELFHKICGPGEVINACHLQTIMNSVLKKSLKSFDGFSLEICRSLVALYDEEHNGKLDFDEFFDLFTELIEWKTAFTNFDEDGNGVFNSYEFRNALNSIGMSVSNNVFRALANRFCDPESGIIKFEDFVMAAIRLAIAFDTLDDRMEETDEEVTFKPDEFLECFLYM